MLQPLVSWFEENQRALPWRATYDPYHVWVSEVMLQQTQVETALPYYERFMREFPCVEDLAAADEEKILTLWAGLGYYQRARNLMAAARLIVERHRGKIPPHYNSLIDLPGIGQYILNAIAEKDLPVIQGVVLVTATAFVLINLIVDIIYGYLNPKIRLA